MRLYQHEQTLRLPKWINTVTSRELWELTKIYKDSGSHMLNVYKVSDIYRLFDVYSGPEMAKALNCSFDELPLLINADYITSVYARWRLKIGR